MTSEWYRPAASSGGSPAKIPCWSWRMSARRPWTERGADGAARADRSGPLTWIQIGSVPGREWIKEIPKLAAAVAKGTVDVRARAVPLADVERAWADAAHTTDRIVVVP